MRAATIPFSEKAEARLVWPERRGRRRSREPGAERQKSRAVPHLSAHQPCASRGAGTSGATSAGLALGAQDAGYGDTIKNASENTESLQRP